MSLADMTSSRGSPPPEACPECDTSASVNSDLHKYQVACTCKPSSVHYACADEPGPPPPAKTDTPPALPPRPPAAAATNRRNNAAVGCSTTDANACKRRKYAWWCVGCGALAAALGGLLAAQHILLRAYTASPRHLETVPAAVPAAMLVLTGVCIMSLARRRNRFSYMIKIVGACCLICALTCVLVTITTTVIHMNKLQALKFCEFTKLTRTCTCYSLPPELQQNGEDEGVRCVFEGVTDCGVVHGALYWCLRGVFALSVAAVLVCIFSSMLAYQLLSHERKKMYWEQLELRCRSLYRPPSGQAAANAGRPPQATCSCCRDCRPQPAWDMSMQHRFWAPGRIGNLYSPNPGAGRKTSAWSWFPWPRGNSQNSRSCRMGGVPQSGDSAYGFCETDNPQPNPNPNATVPYEDRPYPTNFPRNQNYPNFAQPQGTFAQAQSGFAQAQSGFAQAQSGFAQAQGGFAQAQAEFVPQQGGFAQYQEGYGEGSGSFDAQTGVWGPPPPYSPQGRSGSRHHLHQDPATAALLHHHHIDRHQLPIHDPAIMQPHPCRNSYIGHLLPAMLPDMSHEMVRLNPELARLNPELARLNPEMARLNPDLVRINPELARMNQVYPSEVEGLARLQAEMARMGESRFNTLRGHLVAYPTCQRSLGVSMGNLHRDCRMDETVAVECLHQKSGSKISDQSSDSCQMKQGKENLAFQNDKHSPLRASMQDCHRGGNPNTESEVYFADVSSCCNISADCCNRNVSALVGTIENHPESTSESDTGSFTLTRQRPQPQTGSKKRPRNDKMKTQEKIRQEISNSIRLAEHQIEQLNNSMSQRLVEHVRMSQMNDARLNERLNGITERLNESRLSEKKSGNDSRMNESRCSQMSDPRCQLNESRVSQLNESRHSQLNESRHSQPNDSRHNQLNDSRVSQLNESRHSQLNESRVSQLNESRHSQLNDSRVSQLNDSRVSQVNESRDEKSSPKNRKHSMSPLKLTRSSPKTVTSHPRQSSSDSNGSRKTGDFKSGDFKTGDFKTPEFFVPPPPAHSPLSPNTEESLVSDDEAKALPDASCLGPDNKYEQVKEKDELKANHHHCYSDTNTMDSGWQSGSEKHVTD